MSLKLYQINTTLNHPDCMAGFKKNDDEILKSCKLRPQKRPRPMRLANKILLKMNSSLTK